MPISVSFIKRLEALDPQLRGILIALLEELERQREESVTKKEFNELRDVVKDLAEAQKHTEKALLELAEAQRRTEARVEELAEAQRRTDERLNSLALRVEELAEAQKRTEARIEELAEAQRRTEARVEELAEAQRRTDERLNSLALKVEQLADAQKKTDERLNSLALRVEELAEAQKRTEARIEELAEAQRRTEARVEELAEAQRRTDERLNSLALKVEQLAEAQKKTEEEIRILVKRVDAIEERLEGISHSVGYSLENRTYTRLPRLLRERYGVEVEGKLVRKYVAVGNKQIQVNIYGYGKKDGRKVLILGECKVRPSKKEIRRFEKYAGKIAEQEEFELFPVMVAHDFPPEIEEFVKHMNIAHFWSYELEE